jgi:hypothetical protein
MRILFIPIGNDFRQWIRDAVKESLDNPGVKKPPAVNEKQ